MKFTQTPVLGWTGFSIGAVALLLALTHHYGGPFVPQQTVGVSLGEIAADMAKSAARSMIGADQPAPEMRPWDTDRYLALGVAILSALAAVLGIAGLIRQEQWRPAIGAVVLASSVILFQLFAWAVLVIAGVIIIAAFIHSFGDFFDFGWNLKSKVGHDPPYNILNPHHSDV